MGPASAAASAASSAPVTLAVPYDLPRADEALAPLPPPDLPGSTFSQPAVSTLVVTITRTGDFFANGKHLRSHDDLVRVAREAFAADSGVRAIIQADTRVPWGVVVTAMDRLKQGGIAKLAFGVSAAAPPPTPPPSPQPAPPAPAPRARGNMPEDCADICSIGVRCGLGHVKEQGQCEAWCETRNDMVTYGCIALHAQDCDVMKACRKKGGGASPGSRRKGEEGTMGRPR